MNRAAGISESLLISFFISGLKPLLQRELLIARPKSLNKVFSLACLFEDKYEASQMPYPSGPRWQQRSSQPIQYTTTSTPIITDSSTSQKPALLPTPPPPALPALPPSRQNTNRPAPPNSPNIPIRRLTPSEMQERRQRGLCFNCDQKWSANHKCHGKSFMLLISEDEEVEPAAQDDNCSTREEDPVITGDISSLNSMAGPGSPRSLWIWGDINSHRVHVLIDSGSTHNLIQPRLAEKLQLHATPVS
uniref:Uncharacterized protein n=1 Tax=Nelumbo nucifera TaxID=4432 RepID=A0A822YYT7_NELNU|nr:TPA_asm: hypothetical protein HUJ06_013587 [Nelumbo nucifera]